LLIQSLNEANGFRDGITSLAKKKTRIESGKQSFFGTKKENFNLQP
jgi:hypothetical protein